MYRALCNVNIKPIFFHYVSHKIHNVDADCNRHKTHWTNYFQNLQYTSYSHLMHQAVPQGTVVPWGTAFCGAILCRLEVKLCRIIWCVVQRQYIIDFFFFPSWFQVLPENSMQGIYTHEEFMKINQTFSKQYFALYNRGFIPEKIIDQNDRFLLGTPGYSLCYHLQHSFHWSLLILTLHAAVFHLIPYIGLH